MAGVHVEHPAPQVDSPLQEPPAATPQIPHGFNPKEVAANMLQQSMATSIDAIWMQMEELSTSVSAGALIIMPGRGGNMTASQFSTAWDSLTKQLRNSGRVAKASRQGSHRAV
eukprot:9176253-Prorocentrum_lima.AAC.1